MDQADTASNTDCLATNNIMVFNLQAQPPGGMAGDNGTPHIFGLMPWSGAGQGISQSGPEVCQLPDSRYNAKPDFPMEADMMEQDGSPAGWMQPQGFVQSRSGSAGFEMRSNLDASSQSSCTHFHFDNACFPKNVVGHHQASAMSMHCNESTACHQTCSSGICCSYASHLHGRLRSPKGAMSCGDPVSTPNQSVLYQDQTQRGTTGDQGVWKASISQPAQGQPVTFPEKDFKTQESGKMLPHHCNINSEEQSEELQTQNMSPKHQSRCSNQYFSPQNDKADHNIMYFMAVKAQGHCEDWPVQSSMPVSFIKPQPRVVPCSPTFESSTNTSKDGILGLGNQHVSLQSAPKEESRDPEQNENSASHGSRYSAEPLSQTSKDFDSDNFHLQMTPSTPPISAAVHTGTNLVQRAASSTDNSITITSRTNAAANISKIPDTDPISPEDRNPNHASNFSLKSDVNHHPEGSVQDDQNDCDEDVVYLGTDPPSDWNVNRVKSEKDSSIVDGGDSVGAALTYECEAVRANSACKIQSVHAEVTHQEIKSPGYVDLETETTSQPGDEDVPITQVDVDMPRDAGVLKSGGEPQSTSALQSLLSCCIEQTNTLPSEENCSGLKILETVSLAAVQPPGQKVFWQQLSAEGFYRCGCQKGQCSFTSQLQVQFESHLLQAHPAESEYPCVHCGSLERSHDVLLFHLDQHLDFQRFSLYCTEPACDFHSFNPENVVSHMSICHPNLSPHTCWRCSHVFGSLQQFIIHIKRSALQVAICPHCDAKDTDGQRILRHMTTEHPGQVRMIAFHNLMMCRERKMSGWSCPEAFVKKAADSCSGTSDQDGGHRNGAGNGVESGQRIGSGNEIETDSTDKSGTDVEGTGSRTGNDPEETSVGTETDANGIGDGMGTCMKGTGDGTGTDAKETVHGMGTYTKGPDDGIGVDILETGGVTNANGNEEQKEESGIRQISTAEGMVSGSSFPSPVSETNFLCSPSSTNDTDQDHTVAADNDKDLTVTADNAVDKAMTHTNSNAEDVSEFKVFLQWNKQGRQAAEGDVISSELDKAESHNKLGMEPMDYEITADTSADCDPEASDQDDVPSLSGESTISASPKSVSSASLHHKNLDQNEPYHCTVRSADNTIRLMSNKNKSSKTLCSALPQKVAQKTKSKKKKEIDTSPVHKLSKVKTKARVYTCLLCSFISRCSPGIYQHMYSKHKEILQCPVCKGMSKNRTAFYNHLTAFHPEEAKAIYEQGKITKWISITPITTLMDTTNRLQLAKPLKPLNMDCPAQDTALKDSDVKDYAVRDYFMLSGHGKDRNFHCVFCQFSFKKNHRSNAHIYRSMYKHMFLKHIPHLFQCPCCSFIDCSESVDTLSRFLVIYNCLLSFD